MILIGYSAWLYYESSLYRLVVCTANISRPGWSDNPLPSITQCVHLAHCSQLGTLILCLLGAGCAIHVDIYTIVNERDWGACKRILTANRSDTKEVYRTDALDQGISQMQCRSQSSDPRAKCHWTIPALCLWRSKVKGVWPVDLRGWLSAVRHHIHTHTHTHNLFMTLLNFVRDYPGEPVPEM